MDRNRVEQLRIHLLLAAHRDPRRTLRALDRLQRVAARRQSTHLVGMVADLRTTVMLDLQRSLA